MIINIRGTTGSGKSTVVKGLLKEVGGGVPIYGLLGDKYPEAYEARAGDRRLFVLGPYNVDIGGMDAVVGRGGIQACIDLLDKYVDKGQHLIFEGLIISSMWGSTGLWLDKHKPRVIIAKMTTTLDECEAALVERQGLRMKASKTQKVHWAGTNRVCETAAKAGFRVELLDRPDAAQTVLRWLNETPT